MKSMQCCCRNHFYRAREIFGYWQPHTVRVVISGLRKNGFEIVGGNGPRVAMAAAERHPKCKTLHKPLDVERPLRIILTERLRNDFMQAVEPIEGFRAAHVLSDKGYDSDEILDVMTSMNVAR
ncbi:hypothetical protein [Thalassospira lucentensis]|uniref:hypothetical protein n=1 Tax=Thalassospira lucentensis TaxID=168935 RepID=UPI003AA8DD30